MAKKEEPKKDDKAAKGAEKGKAPEKGKEAAAAPVKGGEKGKPAEKGKEGEKKPEEGAAEVKAAPVAAEEGPAIYRVKKVKAKKVKKEEGPVFTKAHPSSIKYAKNPMRRIEVEKVVVNIGVGEGGEKLVKAQKVLELVTKRKSVQTISKTTNRDLGIRKGMPIGAKVTLRAKEALEFLKVALDVKDNRLQLWSFDKEGNFSFGIPDYTDLPGQKYSPEIGIFGMDVCVTLRRPGARVAKRLRERTRIPTSHRISQEEAMKFVSDKFNVEVVM